MMDATQAVFSSQNEIAGAPRRSEGIPPVCLPSIQPGAPACFCPVCGNPCSGEFCSVRCERDSIEYHYKRLLVEDAATERNCRRCCLFHAAENQSSVSLSPGRRRIVEHA